MKRLLLLRFLTIALLLLATGKVKADCTINSDVSASSNPLNGCSGVITINATLTMDVTYNLAASGITQVIVAAPSGKINWTSNNVDLGLPANCILVIQVGSFGLLSNNGAPPCSANRTVSFGGIKVASCNGGGGGIDYDFDQVNAAGGISGLLFSATASSDATVCTGGILNLYSSPVNGVGPYSYSWSGPGGFSSSSQNPVVNPSVAGTYTVTITDVGNKTANASTIVSLTPAVTPSVSIASLSGISVCSGTSVTFTATPTNGGASPSYQWKLNGGNVGTNSNSYTNATLANGDQVSVVMTSNAACASPTTATSNSITMTINPSVTPSVSISANPGASICPSTSVTFTAAPINGGVTPNYQWKLNGGNVGSNQSTYTNAALSNGDQISVVMTSTASCPSPATATSNTITITINSVVVPTISISETQFNLCSGGVDFAAAVTNEGPTPLFQWQVNGVDIPLEENQTFTTTGLVNGDLVTCELYSSEACPSASPILSNTITVSLTGGTTTWVGLSGTWNSPTNWSSGVPNSSISVIIPPGTPFHPLAVAPGSCFNMEVQPGATLEISGSSTLAVYGNFINNGTFIPNTGTLQLLTCSGVGINPHIIGTSNGTQTSFRNLTLNDVSGATLTEDISLSGVLNITNGNFNANGNLVTLLSTSAGTGRIGALTTGTFSGNILQQRFIPGPTTGWTLMGTSVTGATIADWADDFPTSGFPGSTGYAGGFISMYGYDETAPGLFDAVAGYVPVTGLGNSIVNGKGYWVFLGTSLNTTLDITTDIVGPPRTGQVNFGITYTNSGNPTEDGWNLVANPYPSAIDWDNVNWTKSNIDDAVYIYNADNQQYASYSAGVGVNGGSRYLANSQGFYVKANAATPSLIAQETVKTNQAATYIRTTDPLNVLRLKLEGNNMNDEAVIRFTDDATIGYDKTYEALKKRSQIAANPYLSVMQANEDLSIIALPKGQSNLSIPVKTLTGTDGQFTLSWSVNNRFEEEYCMVLEDKKTGVITDMKAFTNYSFELSSNDNDTRFVIHSSHALPAEVVHPSCSSEQKGSITINNRFNENVQVTLVNSKNETMATANFASDSYRFDDLKPGNYNLVFASAGVCNSINQNIEIKGDQMVDASFTLNKETVEMNVNETIEVTPDRPSTSITVDFGDGTIVNPGKGENVAQHRYASEGEYTITVTSGNGNCTDSKTIQVLVFNKDKLAVNQLGGILQMDYNFEEGTNVNLNITNSAGQMAMSQAFRGLTQGRQTLNIAQLEAGVYYVTFNYNDKNVVKKIVK